MRITTTNNGIEKGAMHVSVKVETCMCDDMFKATHYVAILRAMRDTNKGAFYAAMTEFVDEKELENVIDWISKECEGCDDDC